jgi:hypothetical protein
MGFFQGWGEEVRRLLACQNDGEEEKERETSRMCGSGRLGRLFFSFFSLSVRR